MLTREKKNEPHLEPSVAKFTSENAQIVLGREKLFWALWWRLLLPSQFRPCLSQCPTGQAEGGEEKPEPVSSKPRWGFRWEEQFPPLKAAPKNGKKGGIINNWQAKDSVQKPGLQLQKMQVLCKKEKNNNKKNAARAKAPWVKEQKAG